MNYPRTVSGLREKLDASIEALRKCEERAIVGQFALEVMHDIRNPLDALCNLLHMAGEEAEKPAKVREYVALAKEQILTVNHIAGDTLGLVRTSTEASAVPLADLAEAAIRIQHRRITDRRIHLVRDMTESARVKSRRSEILQAISNLLANAIDALPEEGTISIRISKRGDEARILIVDNGHGISNDRLKQLFQPFFTTKGNDGTGLGLALTRRIVERHGGRICVRSSVRAGRTGTAFRICLPTSA